MTADSHVIPSHLSSRPLPSAPPNRIRVLQVSKFWGADRGGVESVLASYAEGLASLGYSVQVLACRPWRSAARLCPQAVDLHELPAPVFASMPFHPAFPLRLRQQMRQADLVHFHIPFPLAEIALPRTPHQRPWVATFHAELTRHPLFIRRLYRSALLRFLERLDAIVVSTPHLAELPLLRPFSSRVRVIPFGGDPRFRQAPPASAFQALPADRGRPIVLFAGRLVPYKGVDVLLQALRGVDADAWIAGDGPERRRLERLASQYGIASQVTFLGHVPDEQLRAAYHRATLLVLPSISNAETFGLVQIEAMAAGVPVVNTLLPTGVNFVSPHGVAGWSVPPGDAGALRQALRQLLGDPVLLRYFSNRARLRARRLFDLQLQTRRLHRLYQDVLPA